jgi:REP element-mobilizing transposase RayT
MRAAGTWAPTATARRISRLRTGWGTGGRNRGDEPGGQTGRFLILEPGGRTGGTDGTFSDTLSVMARLSRIVVVNIPHHVTQRGNARQFILADDDERLVYLNLLRKYVQLHELSMLGYCLLSNHVHLLAVPRKPDALPLALKQTHGRYASYWNAAHRSSGHVWQGRFYSCPLDSYHLWVALRYTELNPVRAGLVAKAESLAVVQRRRALWFRRTGYLSRGGDLEQALVHGNLARVSGCRGNGARDHGDSSVHAHGSSSGHAGIRRHFGANDAAPFGAAERRASGACYGSSSTSNAGIRKTALIRNVHFPRKRKRPVCPRFPRFPVPDFPGLLFAVDGTFAVGVFREGKAAFSGGCKP